MQYQELSISLSYSPVVFYAPMTRWAKPPLVTPLTIKEEGWFTMRYSTGCTSLELMIILMTMSGCNELQVKFKPWWSGPSPRSPRWCQKYTCKVPKHHQDEEFWIDQSSFGGYFPCFMDVMCHFLASEIYTCKNMKYSQTSDPLGIMTSCIFNDHWSSITPGTEKAPWDCIHLKVLYELPSH